jgi:hypothetical protein
MKIHCVHLQICCCLAVCLPLPSYAGFELPYWLYPEWMAAKVMEFHLQNSERIAMAQAQAKNSDKSNDINGQKTIAKPAKNTNFAPVETATAKANDKQLSKEELIELRKQLRDKQ